MNDLIKQFKETVHQVFGNKWWIIGFEPQTIKADGITINQYQIEFTNGVININKVFMLNESLGIDEKIQFTNFLTVVKDEIDSFDKPLEEGGFIN